MPYKFNPFTQTLDETPGLVTSTNAGLLPAGFSYENDVFNVPGDINLDDGVAGFETTLQTITPTADRTISFPDASGTVALIVGTNGQVTYNAAGAQAGLPTLTTDGTNLTLAGRLTNTFTSLADAPAKLLSGTWFTGGTPTTNKPHFLIEPAGTTSTTWSISGTGLGMNAASGFTGNLFDAQLNGASRFSVSSAGALDASGNTIRLRTARTPASATAAGNAGDICWDASYVYVCTATNTWRRIAHATW
jgi:hypothetical protein